MLYTDIVQDSPSSSHTLTRAENQQRGRYLIFGLQPFRSSEKQSQSLFDPHLACKIQFLIDGH